MSDTLREWVARTLFERAEGTTMPWADVGGDARQWWLNDADAVLSVLEAGEQGDGPDWAYEFARLLEVANDMRPYVADFFAKKWEHDEALERARAFEPEAVAAAVERWQAEDAAQHCAACYGIGMVPIPTQFEDMSRCPVCSPAVAGEQDGCAHEWVYDSEGDYGECKLCDASINVVAGFSRTIHQPLPVRPPTGEQESDQ